MNGSSSVARLLDGDKMAPGCREFGIFALLSRSRPHFRGNISGILLLTVPYFVPLFAAGSQ